MAIAIVVLVVDNYLLDKFGPNDRRSIAVLPLANLTPGPDNDSFAGGMHDEILSSLASISSLKVISRTSVLAYRDSIKNLREIGRELDVANILEGTVRRAEDTVRIDVQLIDADTDEQIWSEVYDRSLSVANMLAIQGDIARMVSDSLRAELTPSEYDRLDVIPTENLQAYEFYLAGMNLLSAPLDMEYVSLAMRHFERAVEAEPGFALAWIALADTHVSLSMGDANPVERQAARDALDRADELEAGLPRADIVRGRMASLDGDHEGAIRFFDSAEQAMPGDARLHREKGRAYQVAVELEKSIESYERAVSLDPRDPLSRAWLARIYGKSRQHDRGEEHARTALDFNPDCGYCRWTFGAMRLYRGDDSARVIEALMGPQGWNEQTDWRAFVSAVNAQVMDRDYQAALETVDVWEQLLGENLPVELFAEYRAYLIALERGPEAVARPYREILDEGESMLADNPDDLNATRITGEAHAWLGNREAAVAAAERILSGELLQGNAVMDFWVSDEVFIPAVLYILAPAKEKDLALATLDQYFSSPGHWTIEALRRFPMFDYLHDDPRWEALYEKYRRRDMPR
jgi:TolB-like protein